METARWNEALRGFVKRRKSLVCAATIVDGQRKRLAARRGPAPSNSGSTHTGLALEQSLAYIDEVYEDYLRHGGLTEAQLRGARVLELGPGDNFGVALRFLAAGAARVVTVDKFRSLLDPEQQRMIYAALLDRLDPVHRARVENCLDVGRLEIGGDRLRVVDGVAVEEAARELAGERFDLIVSRAVLEHLYDLDAAFASMDALLEPGGCMAHKVDFRDHGMFTSGGMHALEFLTVPAPLYASMTRHSGRPNRRLADWYRGRLAELGYEFTILATHLVGRETELAPYLDVEHIASAEHRQEVELVESIRPRLRREFGRLEERDLMVTGIFLSAEKPLAADRIPAARQPIAVGTG